MHNIPFKLLNTNTKEIKMEVNKLLDSGQIGFGNKVFEFEKALAKYVGAKYVVALDSCTSALFLSLKYDKAKKVGVPSMTVPLVADAVLEAGKELYFTDKTDWVGSAYRLEGTNVIDSAHQLDKNQCKGMNNNDKVCFSFYPTKSIGSADGGAVATNDKEFADWCRIVSSYGRNQTQKYQNSWEYDIELVGYKRHYTNLQAVICMEQLKLLPEVDKRRKQIVERYNGELGYTNRSMYLYRIMKHERDKFIEFMREAGIECGVHFKPLHMMKAFKNIKVKGNKTKIEFDYQFTVSLPLYSRLKDKEVEYIIRRVKEYESSFCKS